MATTMRLKGGVPILEPHGKIVGPCGLGIARETRVGIIRGFPYALFSYQFRARSQNR